MSKGMSRQLEIQKLQCFVVVLIATYINKQCFHEDYMLKSPTCSHQNPAISSSYRIKLTVSRKILYIDIIGRIPVSSLVRKWKIEIETLNVC